MLSIAEVFSQEHYPAKKENNMDIIITITEEEKRILESVMGVGTIQGWLQHAIDNKIRKRTDAYILELTNLNPKKLTRKEKLVELSKVELPTREDQDDQ